MPRVDPPPHQRLTVGPPAGRRPSVVAPRSAEPFDAALRAPRRPGPDELAAAVPAPPGRLEIAAPAPPPLRPGDRLLVGTGTATAEARLRLGGGVEIHLQCSGGEVTALVLTPAESSRKTLALAMEEVARRLARRGVAFRVRKGGAGSR